MLNMKSENLLIVAGAVWCFAGLNVLGIGISELIGFSMVPALGLAAASIVIFMLFSRMFHRVMAKSTRRIWDFGDTRMSIFKFFDARGYLIMAFMMALGFGLRATGLAPAWFIAFFYTGLGTALCMAGVAFFVARAMSCQGIADMHQRYHTAQ